MMTRKNGIILLLCAINVLIAILIVKINPYGLILEGFPEVSILVGGAALLGTIAGIALVPLKKSMKTFVQLLSALVFFIIFYCTFYNYDDAPGPPSSMLLFLLPFAGIGVTFFIVLVSLQLFVVEALSIKEKFLFLAAYPSDKIYIQNEYDRLKQILATAISEMRLRMADPIMSCSYGDLPHSFARNPTIIHYSGHISPKGMLLRDPDSGNTQEVSADAVAEIFSRRNNQLWLVSLNACTSENVAKAISSQGLYAVAFKDDLFDETAEQFVRSFYNPFNLSNYSRQDALIHGINAFRKLNNTHEVSVWYNGEQVLVNKNTII